MRRIGRCDAPVPNVLDSTGSLLTFTLRSTFEASVSCPIPAAIAAQRAGRRARCR